MIPQRIRVKLYAEDTSRTDVEPFVALFHGFIREARLPGLWIDVVDYGHVRRGPGALLVGHEADLSWDLLDGRPGLSYTRKRGEAPSLEQALRETLEHALEAAAAVEARSGLRLQRQGLSVTLIDRLRAPREPGRIEQLRLALGAAAEPLLGSRHASVDEVSPDDVATDRGDARAAVTLRL